MQKSHHDDERRVHDHVHRVRRLQNPKSVPVTISGRVTECLVHCPRWILRLPPTGDTGLGSAERAIGNSPRAAGNS